jgi:hypothetical protein
MTAHLIRKLIENIKKYRKKEDNFINDKSGIAP